MDSIIRQRVFFYGDDKQIKDMLKAVANKKQRRCFDFNKILPIPDTVYMGQLNSEALSIYGENNWYEWCKVHWGSMNNACDPELCGHMLEFKTNWGVPRPIYMELSRQYPDIKIKVDYASKDGSIVGKELYSAGNVTNVDDQTKAEIVYALWPEAC